MPEAINGDNGQVCCIGKHHHTYWANRQSQSAFLHSLGKFLYHKPDKKFSATQIVLYFTNRVNFSDAKIYDFISFKNLFILDDLNYTFLD